MRDRPGGEAEIGFRLAAAGREKEQVDDFAIGMQPVLQTGQVQQDEGELERPPARGTLRRRISILAGVALAGGACNGLVHRAECEAGMAVPMQQGDARGDAIPRLTGGIDEALRCRLTRGAGDARNRRLLQRDPGLVVRREMAEAVAQRVRSARCERGQRLHAEFDIADILVRLDALDFGGGQEIGMGGTDDAIVVGRPSGGRVAAHRIVRDVAVVQVGERRIQVGRGVAGDIGARIEPGRGTHFKPHLERKGDVAEAAARIVAAVDDHHGQRHQMALRPVRLVERVGARVRLKDEGAAGALRSGRAGDEHRPTAAVLRDRQCCDFAEHVRGLSSRPRSLS